MALTLMNFASCFISQRLVSANFFITIMVLAVFLVLDKKYGSDLSNYKLTFFFLDLICVIALVSILVPRYFKQNPPPTNSNTTQTTPPPSTPPENSQSGNNNTDYANLYSTLSINILKEVGMPYSTLARHLDNNNQLNVAGLNISTEQLSQIESLAQPIYSTLNNYITNGQQITAALIDSDNDLHSQIVALSNMLNNFAGE